MPQRATQNTIHWHTAWCCNRNPKCVPNAGLRLAQRRRRWADIHSTPCQRVVLSQRPGFQEGGGGCGGRISAKKKRGANDLTHAL